MADNLENTEKLFFIDFIISQEESHHINNLLSSLCFAYWFIILIAELKGLPNIAKLEYARKLLLWNKLTIYMMKNLYKSINLYI